MGTNPEGFDPDDFLAGITAAMEMARPSGDQGLYVPLAGDPNATDPDTDADGVPWNPAALIAEEFYWTPLTAAVEFAPTTDVYAPEGSVQQKDVITITTLNLDPTYPKIKYGGLVYKLRTAGTPIALGAVDVWSATYVRADS